MCDGKMITFDLIQEHFSMDETVKVLEPVSLRLEMERIGKKIAKEIAMEIAKRK